MTFFDFVASYLVYSLTAFPNLRFAPKITFVFTTPGSLIDKRLEASKNVCLKIDKRKEKSMFAFLQYYVMDGQF